MQTAGLLKSLCGFQRPLVRLSGGDRVTNERINLIYCVIIDLPRGGIGLDRTLAWTKESLQAPRLAHYGSFVS
jgi:hypothetical protein